MRSKMLLILVVVLLLTNVAMLYYFTRETKETPKEEVKTDTLSRNEKQVEYVRTSLKLDEKQLAAYRALRAQRDSIVRPMNEALRVVKMKMIGFLKQPATEIPESLVAQTAADITAKQKEIEIAYYYHFRRVQAICRPDQLPLLDSVLTRMVIRNTGGDSTQKK